MNVPPEQFVDFARQMRELGAVSLQVEDGKVSVTFAPPPPAGVVVAGGNVRSLRREPEEREREDGKTDRQRERDAIVAGLTGG